MRTSSRQRGSFLVATLLMLAVCRGQTPEARCSQSHARYNSSFLDIGLSVSVVERLWGKPTQVKAGAHDGHDLLGYDLGSCYFWIEVLREGPTPKAFKYELASGAIREPSPNPQSRIVLQPKDMTPEPAPSAPQSPPARVDLNSESLIGIKSLSVLVEKLSPDAESRGLSRNTLKTDVELRLRRTGVRISSAQDHRLTADDPELYLNVNVLCSHQASLPLCADNVSLQLRQRVTPLRDQTNETDASTWDASTVGILGETNLVSGVREAVADLIDHFLNDYLAANPK
jgi:hypothetical protein